MALDGLAPAAGCARAAGRHAAGGRPGRAAEARPARDRDRGGRARAPPAPLRVGGRGADDLGALRRRGGDPRRHRAPRVLAPAGAPPHPDGARRRRDRRDPRDVVQPAVARGEADARHAAPPPREAEPLRLPGRDVRRRRRRGDGGLRARLPGDRRPGAEDAAVRDRERASRSRVQAASRSRRPCASGAAAAPGRRARRASTARAGRTTPSARGAASRSTSCSRCSSRSADGRSSARRSSPRRCRSPASSRRATARRCRSRSPRRRSTRSPRSTPTSAGRRPCSDSSRATSARARRPSRCTRCSARWRRVGRAR